MMEFLNFDLFEETYINFQVHFIRGTSDHARYNLHNNEWFSLLCMLEVRNAFYTNLLEFISSKYKVKHILY